MSAWLNSALESTEAMLNNLDQKAAEKAQELKEKDIKILPDFVTKDDQDEPNVTSDQLFEFLNDTSQTDVDLANDDGEKPSETIVKKQKKATAVSPPRRLRNNNTNKSGAQQGGNEELDPNLSPEALRSKCQHLIDENKLLKREINTLHDEVTSYTTRIRSTQDTLSDVKDKLQRSERRLAKSQAEKKELESTVTTMKENATANGQEITESKRKLKAYDIQVAELQQSKVQVLRDLTAAKQEHEKEVHALELQLKELSQGKSAVEGSLTESQTLAEKKLEEAESTILELETELETSRNELSNANDQIQTLKGGLAKSNTDLTVLQQEFTEYKNRAARVLQTKEKVIQDLRDASENGAGAPGGVTRADLIQAQTEKQAAQTALEESEGLVEQLRSEIQGLQDQVQDNVDLAEAQVKELQKALRDQNNQLKLAQDRANADLEEMKVLKETEREQRMEAQNQLALRTAELDQAKNQLMKKSNIAPGSSNKVAELTSALLKKQNIIEDLEMKKNTLTLQLGAEKSRREAHIALPMPVQNPNPDGWGDGQRMRPIRSLIGRSSLKDIPSLSQAATFLDAFSVRLGVFLRVYPLARVFVIFYMILLHVWVLVVLLTYSPEIHDHNGQVLDPGRNPHHP